jgi:hypothetical protein
VSQAPLVSTISGAIAAQIAAGEGDQIIGRAPHSGRVTKCSLSPEAAVTGDTAIKRTFTLVSKGQDGSGSTVLATLDLITGTDLVAFDEKEFTLSGAIVAEGDILAVVEVVVSTGIAHSGGTVIVQIARS